MTGVMISLQCGSTWWMQFVSTDDTTGAAVNVTAPRMEIRAHGFTDPNSAATVLYTSVGGSPTIVLTQPTANTVLATIAGATTKNLLAGDVGDWDCYATDPSGNPVLLGAGQFRSTPNVTSL